MGEARRRRDRERDLGKAPAVIEDANVAEPARVWRTNELPRPLGKQERGLVLGFPVEVQLATCSISIKGGLLDRQLLRYALLFWDRLVLPYSTLFGMFGLGVGPDEQFLIGEGLLEVPIYALDGDAAHGVALSHIMAFYELEARDPGSWALAQGADSLLLKDVEVENSRALLVALHKAVPVPTQDVPLAELLEFKQRRWPELLALRSHLESTCQELAHADDLRLAFRTKTDAVTRACEDAIRVAQESGLPWRLASPTVSFSVKDALQAGVFAYPLTGDLAIAAGMGLVGGIKVSTATSAKGLHSSLLPYRYVTQFHDEVYGVV